MPATTPRSPRRQLPLWATLFTLAGLALLCALGTWQLKRAAWKDGLIAQRDAILAQPPAPYDGARLRAVTAGDDARFIAYITLQGAYLHDRAILIGPRTRQGETGHHLITPLELDDGTVILVNRGWTYRATVPPAARAAIKVTGHLRTPETPNRFVPANDPARHQWHSLDIPAMARHMGIPALSPYILYATAEDPAASPAIPHDLVTALPANHRAYALFWFTMALVLAGIYALRFLRRS